MIATVGRVTSEAPGAVMIATSRPPADNLSNTVTVCWADARNISPDQRRKAYALMGEIAAWSGSSPEEVKAAMKVDFRQRAFGGLQQGLISLADCTMTEARLFISMLIDFMLEMDVPSKVPLWDYNDDVGAYVYACLMHRKCAVCGRKADLHHIDRVGMGRDRREICHIGMQALPLCRTHHEEAHQHGDAWLMEKYHLAAVEIDQKIAKVYRLRGETK